MTSCFQGTAHCWRHTSEYKANDGQNRLRYRHRISKVSTLSLRKGRGRWQMMLIITSEHMVPYRKLRKKHKQYYARWLPKTTGEKKKRSPSRSIPKHYKLSQMGRVPYSSRTQKTLFLSSSDWSSQYTYQGRTVNKN